METSKEIKAIKGIRDVQKFDHNPFLEQAIEDIKIIKKTQIVKPKNTSEIQIVVNSGGEVTGHTAFMRYIEVEEEKFAKLYLSQFAAFWELKSNSIRVFGYIINNLQPRQDMFIVYMDKALQHTKYKYAKEVNTGLVGLIEAGIIAKSIYENHYFINPMIVFNGDRVTFAKTYIRKKSLEQNPNQISLF
jgi:Firmicute plasmid replication protein (RepL)